MEKTIRNRGNSMYKGSGDGRKIRDYEGLTGRSTESKTERRVV